jgi:ATP-binding cassette, subfamily B, multidrug efflux pump
MKKKSLGLSSLLPYLKGNRLLLVSSFVLALCSVSCKMAIPFVTGLAIDLLRKEDFTPSSLTPYLFLASGLLILGSVFRYFFDYALSKCGQRVVKNMRDKAFDALNEVPLSYLDTHPHGDLLLRLTNDIETVQTGLITGAGALFEGAVQILITIFFMFYLNWALALAVILLTPISILVSRFVSKSNSVYFKQQNAKMGELTAHCLEELGNLEAIHCFGMEEKRENEFLVKDEEVRKANFKATFASAWINPSTRLVNNLIYASIILFGAYLLLASPSWLGISFTVGALSSFLSYSLQYMTPFNEIADVASDVFYATASLDRVEQLVHAPRDIDEGNEKLSGQISSLEAKGICFSYDGKRQIIKDFNLDVYKGHKIALVGPTGCGKTTIINLLMRFYDPQQGSFNMNGMSTKDIKKAEMRSHIGMVLQETWLAKASIRDNIAFGKSGASEEEIVEAAKKAHADEFIRRLSEGYDTIINNETGLSQGEKQLLCVARILLVKPEIVLLDEATSNIDLRTELALGKAFDELMEGKTSLVVAHRLSTIRNADLILVLKDGEIIEQGNFAELMAKNGFFADLYQSQLA